MTDIEQLQKEYIYALVAGKHFSDAVTSSGVKRLMWKAGVSRLPNDTVAEIRLHMANELNKVAKRLLVLHEYQDRSTITPEQLRLVLKLDGYVLAASSAKTGRSPNTTATKDGKKKTTRAKQGRVARRNVRLYQKTTELLLRVSPFDRLVRHMAGSQDDDDKKLRFSQNVVRLIQLHIETYVVKLLKAGSLVAKVARVQGVKPVHIRAALEVSDVLDH